MMNNGSWNECYFPAVDVRAIKKETHMKLAIIALSTAALIVSAPAAFAAGVSSKTPGHQMQVAKKKGKLAVHGASAYSPGHKMKTAKQNGTYTGRGASHYTPSHQTTLSNTRQTTGMTTGANTRQTTGSSTLTTGSSTQTTGSSTRR
jgi:hypothetical protein